MRAIRRGHKNGCPVTTVADPERVLLVCTRNMSPGAGEQTLNDRTARAIWLAKGIKSDLVNLTRSSRGGQHQLLTGRQWRLTVTIVAPIAVALLVWSQIRLGKAGSSPWQTVSSYVLNNMPNAEYWMPSTVVRFGRRSLYLLTLAAQRLNWGIAANYLNPVNSSLGAFNTLPFYAEFYLDTGWPGVILLSLVWGFAMSIALAQASLPGASAEVRVLAGLFLSSIVHSFRASVFSYWESWIAIVILIILAVVTRTRRKIPIPIGDAASHSWNIAYLRRHCER